MKSLLKVLNDCSNGKGINTGEEKKYGLDKSTV